MADPHNALPSTYFLDNSPFRIGSSPKITQLVFMAKEGLGVLLATVLSMYEENYDQHITDAQVSQPRAI